RDPPNQGDRAGEDHAQKIEVSIQAAKAACVRWASVTEWVRPVRKKEGAGVGAVGGRVVHAVMEGLDLSQERNALERVVSGLIRAQAGPLVLDQRWLESCESVVRRILRDPIVDRARVARERWQEVSFAFPEKDGVVSGTIDLCFPIDASRKKWVVVDWKS